MRPKLLFVSPVFPYPISCGQHNRVLNLLLACARNHEVTFVGPKPSMLEGESWIESKGIKTNYVQENKTTRPMVMDFVSNALHVKRLVRPAILKYLRPYADVLQTLDLSSFSVIWVERLMLARLLSEHPQRTIVDLDDIEHIKQYRRFRLHPFSIEGLGDLWRIIRYFAKELLESRRFRTCVVCSDKDRDYLNKWGIENILVVPNGIDPQFKQNSCRRDNSVSKIHLVFLGDMAYEPNNDAVLWFANDVLPLITEELPNVVFEVIGGNPPADLQNKLCGRVKFLGFVEDLSAALKNYDLFVAPIRFGSGTKLKILEAFAHGLPVVTTPIGSEGLYLVDGKHALIATSARDFANKVIAVCGDKSMAGSLMGHATALIKERFLWSSIQEQLADSLMER
ncbi:MAG: glycosyltransferase family 4 protein [Proteobacteria bacterium]|nr:glycosyltransferase family 4 protein [Pseudomonadota bacterium]